MWLILWTTVGLAQEVWRAELENGTVSFTDSPSTQADYERFNVDGPPPEVGKVNLRSFPALDTYDGLIVDAATRYGVDPALVKAVVLAESGMNPDAVSRSGAQGLMQLMPPTASDLGVTDAFDPAQCIDGGTRYLAQMLRIFRGDRRLALAGYNAGPNRVKKTMTVPNIPETQTYVKRVEALRRYFKRTRPISSTSEQQ
jgi:soluble lytic murein transglycosylase-like protein